METNDTSIKSRNHLARLVLAAFVFTFVIARILVIFIMDGKLPPQLFFHVSGTHVHHLNYGIFLLSIIGGVLIFGRPTGSCAFVHRIDLRRRPRPDIRRIRHVASPRRPILATSQLRRRGHGRIDAGPDRLRLNAQEVAPQTFHHPRGPDHHALHLWIRHAQIAEMGRPAASARDSTNSKTAGLRK